MARDNKGGFIISRGLLYHNDKVEGQSICQLCVPECRRDRVLKLAHDSVFGGHLGERKTCLLYTSPSPRDRQKSRMPSSA